MEQDKENKKKKATQKYNLNEIDDVWGSLADDDHDEGEIFDGESLLYGDGYADVSDESEQDLYGYDEQYEDEDLLYADTSPDLTMEDNLETDAGIEQPEVIEVVDLTADTPAESTEEELISDEPVEAAPEKVEFEAIITLATGLRLETARARLAHPRNDTIWLVDGETGDEMSIPFEQITCIQLSGTPAGISERQKESSRREIIKTVDGTSHQVLVCTGQVLEGLLCCFSTDEQTGFPVTLFPQSGIARRTQDRQLRDILLEKRFISPTILQRALREFELLKSMPFEKVVAQRTRIPLAEIKKALDDAEQNQMLGMQTGEILLISGLVNEEQILDAMEYHEYLQNLQFSEFLVEKKVVREVEVYAALAEKHRIPFVDLRSRKISREHLTLLPQNIVESYEILPLVKKDDMLLVATHSVDNIKHSKSIAKSAGCREVKYVLSPPSQIRKIIHMAFKQNS